MKFNLLAAVGLVSLAGLIMADDDPSSVLSEFYATPPTVTGSQLTALASALESVESTWTDSPQYTSAIDAVYSAAPASIQSFLKTGIWDDSLTAQPWFSSAVPPSAQSALSAQEAALLSVQYVVLGTPTTTGSKNAARATGGVVAAAVGVVGAVGVMVVL